MDPTRDHIIYLNPTNPTTGRDWIYEEDIHRYLLLNPAARRRIMSEVWRRGQAGLPTAFLYHPRLRKGVIFHPWNTDYDFVRLLQHQLFELTWEWMEIPETEPI